MGLLGIKCGAANSGVFYNSCNYGILTKIGSLGSRDRTAVICKAGNITVANCFYLDGTPGNTGINVATQEPNVTKFFKTSEDENAMTTAKVVEALNNYIELKGVIEEGDTEVNTTGWCKWVVGDNNLPALDFDTEWNGTDWITVTD